MDSWKVEANQFARWAVSSLFDAGFLILWAALQFGGAWALQKTPLAGLDRVILVSLQVLFAITTLAPILAYVVTDTVGIYYQGRTRIVKQRHRFEIMIDTLECPQCKLTKQQAEFLLNCPKCNHAWTPIND